MGAHEAAPDATELAPVGQIGGLIGAIGGHAADVRGRAAGLGERGEDVLERLLELGDKLVAPEPLRRVPPTWPATNTIRPAGASIPLAYPIGGAHPARSRTRMT